MTDKRRKQIADEIDKILSKVSDDKKESNPAAALMIMINFTLGAVWADQHPQWVSVEEELPKEHEWILGFSLKRSYIDVYNFDSNGLIEAHGITHWMPLPQPPKKGGAQ